MAVPTKTRGYGRLLAEFMDRGYRFSRFSELPQELGELLLRHDIDFDVDLAHAMSLVEDDLGVKATYFFMVSSPSYNLFAPENVRTVRSLRERGHEVSVHFDPTIYEDLESGFRRERQVFESLFDVKLQCISIHRPIASILDNDMTIDGVRHTYQPVYFSRMKYFADSQGTFRYGHPLQSKEVAQGRSLHLLIHPIWWITNATSPVSVLNGFLDFRVRAFQEHMARNCKPYREHLDSTRPAETPRAVA
ncbi:MAG: hypothetical protein ABIP48_13065 [Planctomycetota bacterium]